MRPPRWLLASLLLLLSLAALAGLWLLATRNTWGESDFYKYWSASYLLSTGQDPYDPQLMRQVQQTHIPARADEVIMAWNPPTLLLFLLPLAWFSYPVAKGVWLILNVAMLIGISVLIARLYLARERRRTIQAFVLFLIAFPPVLISLAMGQVTLLVPLGLLACLALARQERWFGAGAALILTTIKPHLVLLAWIYLLVHMARRRALAGWLGLAATGAASALLLFLLRPPILNDLAGLLQMAPVDWATATIGGLLNYLQVTDAGRYLLLLLLPLPILLERFARRMPLETGVALLTLVPLPTTFFGWSFDQVILLLPIALVFSWISRLPGRLLRAAFAAAVLLSLAVQLLQLVSSWNDVYSVWVPLFWWLLAGLSWSACRRATGQPGERSQASGQIHG